VETGASVSAAALAASVPGTWPRDSGATVGCRRVVGQAHGSALPYGGRRILGGLAACVIAMLLLALDYEVRPHLPQYFGDNDIYVLVIVLAMEFIVVWRTALAMMSRR
jgi:uncharacterized membrane protein